MASDVDQLLNPRQLHQDRVKSDIFLYTCWVYVAEQKIKEI